MNGKKAFLSSFTVAFSVMICAFLGIYWSLGSTPQAAGTPQSGVPIYQPGPQDSKTLLLGVENGEVNFFFLVKLNALQNKVNFISIPGNLKLDTANRTLNESLKYAGVMQCVYDLKQEFEVNIDYHLYCNSESLEKILSSFNGLDISQLEDSLPQSIQQLLLKGSNYLDTGTLIKAVRMSAGMLDNALGLEFLNKAGCVLLEHNIENLLTYSLSDIKNNFSGLNTNLNVQSLSQLERILTFLNQSEVVFERLVLSDDADNKQQLWDMLNN